jgi:phosphoglycerate kinase
MEKGESGLKSIRDLELKGKRVILRADLNVPTDDSGSISDDFRIRQAVPTISYILSKNPKQLVIMSHLGRPDGRVVESLRLTAVAQRLSELIKKPVVKTDDCITKLPSDQIVLLENLRFHKEEEENDKAFAEKLSKYADYYVNDAMGTAHRAHASTVGITKLIPSVAGLLLENEVKILSALKQPKKPFVAVIGGAKISEKLGVIKNFSKQADFVLVGGAVANTFLMARGTEIGSSRYEPDMIEAAKRILKDNPETKIGKDVFTKVMLPVDLVVGNEKGETRVVDLSKSESIEKGEMAKDIGPKSTELFVKAIKKARTIVWSGPMGVFEEEAFANGTKAVAAAISHSRAKRIVGGGDTNEALSRLKLWDKVGFVSTAGSAMLEYIERGDLPAISAIRQH